MRNIIIEICEQKMAYRRRFCDYCWLANVSADEDLQAELERMGREGLIKQIDRMPGGFISGSYLIGCSHEHAKRV